MIGKRWDKEKVDHMVYLFFHLGKTAAETATALNENTETVANRTQFLRHKFAVRVVRVVIEGREKIIVVRLGHKYMSHIEGRSLASKAGWRSRKDLSAKKPESDRPVRGPKMIPCLMCSKTFKSGDPGERVCHPCKGTASWHVGY